MRIPEEIHEKARSDILDFDEIVQRVRQTHQVVDVQEYQAHLFANLGKEYKRLHRLYSDLVHRYNEDTWNLRQQVSALQQTLNEHQEQYEEMKNELRQSIQYEAKREWESKSKSLIRENEELKARVKAAEFHAKEYKAQRDSIDREYQGLKGRWNKSIENKDVMIRDLNKKIDDLRSQLNRFIPLRKKVPEGEDVVTFYLEALQRLLFVAPDYLKLKNEHKELQAEYNRLKIEYEQIVKQPE